MLISHPIHPTFNTQHFLEETTASSRKKKHRALAKLDALPVWNISFLQLHRKFCNDSPNLSSRPSQRMARHRNWVFCPLNCEMKNQLSSVWGSKQSSDESSIFWPELHTQRGFRFPICGLQKTHDTVPWKWGRQVEALVSCSLVM